MIVEIQKNHLSKDVEDGKYRIQKLTGNRSLEQNSYYWTILEGLSEHTGHTKEEMHEYFKKEFLSEEGKYITVYKSTTGMEKADFSQYINSIRGWALTHLGYFIPDPNI